MNKVHISSEKKHNILLTSYMRPELTKQAITKALGWQKLDKLVVVIDGLRKGAETQEALWRSETIQVVESFDESSHLELWVYEENVGITEHNLRIQERALTNLADFIWVEEDIDLDFDKFVKLRMDHLHKDNPLLLSGFSHFDHADESETAVKGNLFLPLWGIAINNSFHDLILKTWRDKKLEQKFVQRAISQVLPSKTARQKLHLRSAIKYWTEHARWGLDSSNRWDSLANYALWSVNNYSLSSMNRIADDTSYLDFRGMNQRVKPLAAKEHKAEFKIVGSAKFCIGCEVAGSRINPKISKRMQDSLRFRLRNAISRVSSR